MKRSGIRETLFFVANLAPDYAMLHPGYNPAQSY
jgi:hypothetical protein